jgi:nitrate reductase cytochrome c-type subunit
MFALIVCVELQLPSNLDRGRRNRKMRIVAVALAVILLATATYAQDAGGVGGGKGGGKRNSSKNTEQQKEDPQKKKAAEDAYKAGLKTIPDAKEKYDPWRNAR